MRAATAKPSGDEPITDDDYRALAAFRRSLRMFLHFSEEAARAAGLTPAQHQLLLAVKGAGDAGGPTIGTVAESLQIRHHSAVELVDRAHAAGLLRRVPDARDGRVQRLALTRRGDTVLRRLSGLHRDELRRFERDVLVHLRQLGGPPAPPTTPQPSPRARPRRSSS